jgi:hypothetical protein
MNEFTCLCGPSPKGVSRVGDVDADAQSRLEPHWAEFPVVASGWAALNRQTSSSLDRPDGAPMVAAERLVTNLQPAAASGMRPHRTALPEL